MSDSIDKTETEQVETQEESYVSKKAYEGVSNDMHRFKSKAKEAEARANELEAQLKAIEEEKMREQNQWEDLFKRKSEEYEALQNTVSEKEQRYVQTAKKNALKMELGEVRDEYLVHANLNDIALNEDGSINTESLHNVANKFRENHASLLPKNNTNTSTSMPAQSEHEPREVTREELFEMLKGKSPQERMVIAEKYKGKIKEN